MTINRAGMSPLAVSSELRRSASPAAPSSLDEALWQRLMSATETAGGDPAGFAATWLALQCAMIRGGPPRAPS